MDSEHASRIAAILGLDPDETPMVATAEVCGLIRELQAKLGELETRNQELRNQLEAGHGCQGDELREREELYRLLADNTDDFVAINHVDGRRLYVSPSFYQVTGWTPEEFRSGDWFLRVHPDDLAMVEQARAANLAGEGTRAEYRILCKDGSWLWVDSRCKPLPGSDGRTERMLLWSRDITDRKRAEEALRQSEARLRRVMGGARCCLWTAEVHIRDGKQASDDPNSYVWSIRIEPDDALPELFGFVAAARDGQPLTLRHVNEFVPPGERATKNAAGAEVLSAGRDHYFQEFRCIDREGEEHWFHEEVSLRRLAPGRWEAFGVWVDVTERRRAEEALRASENWLRQVVRHARCCLWTAEVHALESLAADGNGDPYIWSLRIEPDNVVPEAFRFAAEGQTGNDVDVSHLNNLVPPGEKEAKNAVGAEALSAGRDHYSQEFRCIDRHGNEHWLHEAVSLQPLAPGRWNAFGVWIDVTERRRAEASCRESEIRFGAIFAQAAVGIALVSPQGNWLLVNRRLCEIVGYSQEELVTKSFQDITHPDDLAADLKCVERMLAREIDSYAVEKRYRRKDGSFVWTNLTVSLTWTPTGAPDYFISVVEDIDARKQAEEALRKSEADLGEAKRLAGLGNWEWDLRTDTHTWSEEIYRFYGRDPALSPAVYPEVRRYFTPESWERLSQAVEQSIAAGLPYECDAEVAGDDGTRRWITARGEAVRGGNGEVVRLHGTVQDITERKRAEKRLRALNQQLQALQLAFRRLAASKTLVDIMAVARTTARRLTDADGATFVLRDDGMCFYADEDAIEPLWKGKRFPLSACISGWVMLNDSSVVIEDIYADPRIPAEAYRPTFVKSLAMVPIRTTEPVGAIGNYWASPHRASDDELGLLRSLADGVAVAMENVRSCELLEQRVQERTAEIRAANEELDAFAYAVSHDLRAPLRAMSGFSHALLEDFGDGLPAGARELLDEVIAGSRRMGELIDGLLNLSRGTRGELNRDQVNVTELATRILADMAANEPTRRVEWQVEPGLVVRGDLRMLEAVLENLLGNAWKYTAARPLATIRVRSEHTPEEFVFSVEDNGAGFDMRHAGKLFQPFQRLHRQDEFPGIGIGLATVRRIMNRHGGTVVAEGAPGKGAVFRCRLPRGGSEEEGHTA